MGGSTTRGSVSTTASTTSAPPSAWVSSRSWSSILAHRNAVAMRYNELLSGIDGLGLPCPDDDDHQRSWFVYVVALPEGTDREAVIVALESRGVQTGPLPPVHPPAELHA